MELAAGASGEETARGGVAGFRMLPRRRLVDGLMAAGNARLVLLEAPAGYSKTTTLELWDEADPRPFGWIRARPGFNGPGRMIEMIVEELERIGEIGPEVMLATSAPSPDLPLISAVLGKAIGRLDPFVLVVDDAHLIEDGDAWRIIESVVLSLPPGAQVAIGSRHPPGFPVGRLRAGRELYELGMGDLALTRGEGRELLAGLDLDLGKRADEIHRQTEGWPAAIYLAGLAIRQDPNAVPEGASFDGGDRILVEYFRDEFIRGLPQEAVRFMYFTSILDELNGPVCDAVTGSRDSALRLESLARENALIVPLDRSYSRFRYHHLFADMLRLELAHRAPEAEPGLHRRAAAWLAAHGEIPRATDHAIAAGNLELAGALIWLDIADILGSGRVPSLDHWFRLIGDDATARVPALILARAHREMAMGRGEESHHWLTVAEREIAEGDPCFGDMLTIRVTMGPDGPAAMIADSKRAAELLDSTNPWLVPLGLYRGVGLYLEEEDGAEELIRTAVSEAATVSPIIQNLALAQLALLELDRDRVEEAFRHIARARDQVERCGLASLGAMTLVFAVLAEVQVRRGSLDRSAEALTRCLEMSQEIRDFIPWFEAEILLSLCRTMISSGRLKAVPEMADRAEAIVSRIADPPRLLRSLASVRSKLESPGAGGIDLTLAELRTLTFLPTHHSFREISDQLCLSPNTVKTQASSLYRKLGVNSRAEAVMEGRRLGLLD